jgi:site-specific DNA-cytosine methylase
MVQTHKKKTPYTCLTLFSGIGGGALGFQQAGYELVGGLDSWEEACIDYEYLTGSKAHHVDLATLEPHELRALVGARRPDVLFTSPPCKAFSGCLPQAKSRTAKYVALSSLAERGVWLALEAWDTPPPIILIENVPRIQSRGRNWLDAITSLLHGYGYAVTESTHDCGELGGLAQKRRRFLMIARHVPQVGEFVYEPPKQVLRGVGEVFSLLPVPVPKQDVQPGGVMHTLGNLSAMNWLRLALVPAGGDWRDLPERVMLPHRAARQNGCYGVVGWEDAARTVVGHATVQAARSNVADPRVTCVRRPGSEGVTSWDAPSTTVIAHGRHFNGPWQVADPRITFAPRSSCYGVQEEGEPACTVIGHAHHDKGRYIFADPRLTCSPRATAYGVQSFAESSGCIVGHACHDNGRYAVADERDVMRATHVLRTRDGEIYLEGEPLDLESRKAMHLVIAARDGTWHRPMTTLELAALQSFPMWHQGDWLKLHGENKAAWRQKIGNAVPPMTAKAIAETIARSLDASLHGAFLMAGEPVWVQPDDVAEEVQVDDGLEQRG